MPKPMTVYFPVPKGPITSELALTVFDDGVAIARLPMGYPADNVADQAMARMHLKRTGKWQTTPGGRRAAAVFLMPSG